MNFLAKIKRVWLVVLVIVLAIPLLAWGGKYLKKLKLSKRYKAVYNCSINEDYWVDKKKGDKEKREQMVSYANMVLSQEVLSKENHQLQLDYILLSYIRKDSTVRGRIVDTTSNRGELPRKKNILFFTDKGSYLGLPIESKGPKSKTRDYKNFYSASKQLVYKLNDSALKFPQWHTTRTDTVLNTGFRLIFTYPLTWTLGNDKDTLGLECVEVSYSSPVQEYFAMNNMMKALGIETVHKGIAAVNGVLLIDKKTGRIIRLTEDGSFIGNMEVKTSGENTLWPSEYRYNKHFVIDSLIKKPRKKIFGIF